MKTNSRIVSIMPWLICAVGALFYSYEYFLRITPSVMTTELKHYFHIGDGALGDLSAFYYYIYTPMQLIVGLLMDHYGPRRLLTLATLSCVMGSIIFASTPLLFVAKMGRLFIGLGSAFVFVGVLKLATSWLPQRYFAMFAGITTTLGMIGAILGDNIMTAIKNVLGWQETILISAAFGVAITLLIALFVRDQKNNLKRKSATVVIVSFKEALLNLLHIIEMPQYWIVGVIGALLYLPASVFAELWGIPFLETRLQFNDDAAASAVSMVFLGCALGSPLYGWISDRIRRRALPLTVSGIVSAIFLLIILFVPHLPHWSVYILLFFFGFAAGGQSIVFAISKELGLEKLSGSSLAFTNFTVMLGGLILQPLLGYILQYTNQDFHLALLIIPICLFLSVVLSQFVLKETFCKTVSLTSD